MKTAQHVSLALVFAVLALAGCKPPPDSVFYNRGTPESLLDVSSEVVNLSVATPNDLAELTKWVQSDQPTRAELYCTEGDMRCTQARNVLTSRGVPVMTVPSGAYSVALVYERLLARDCKSRFVDNSRNSYNANSPSFGCSVAANIVQHVSDKKQFIDPNLMDVPMATGAVQAYNRAYTPRSTQQPQPYQINRSLTQMSNSQ